jgi:flagellar motility protein MotE (MotC chaperone)
MRYKRVNNYNEMSAIESTIIDLIQNEVEQENIIKIIKDNYGLNEKDVIERLKDVLNSIQVIEKTGKKKKIKLKNNPGFLTTIKQDQFKFYQYILIH